MSAIPASARTKRVRMNWYVPFTRLDTRYEADYAMKFGGYSALSVQGFGALIEFIRVVRTFQHPATAQDVLAGVVGLVVLAGLTVLLVAIGIELNRRQAMWAAVTLATLAGLGTFLRLGQGWVALISLPSAMSIGGSILCVRGALALKRQKVDLNEVFS